MTKSSKDSGKKTKAGKAVAPDEMTDAVETARVTRELEAISLDEIHSIHYAFQFEITHRMWRRGMKVIEVPIIFTERLQGHSKMSGHVMREALWMSWRLLVQNRLRRRVGPVARG